jgi:hypothetical protein
MSQDVGTMLVSSSGVEQLSEMFNVCPHTPLQFRENQAVFVETISGTNDGHVELLLM